MPRLSPHSDTFLNHHAAMRPSITVLVFERRRSAISPCHARLATESIPPARVRYRKNTTTPPLYNNP